LRANHNMGETNSGKNWWKHGRFSIIGEYVPGLLPAQSLRLWSDDTSLSCSSIYSERFQ